MHPVILRQLASDHIRDLLTAMQARMPSSGP